MTYEKILVLAKRLASFICDVFLPKADLIEREEAAMLLLEKTVEFKWRPLLIEHEENDKTVISIQEYKLRKNKRK